MTRGWLVPAVVGVLLAAPGAPSQTLNPSAGDMLRTQRPLTTPEIANILDQSRRAMNGKTFRLGYVPTGPGMEILMGPNGRPHFVRGVSGRNETSGGVSTSNGVSTEWHRENVHVDIVSVTEYTSTPARSCNGSALDGELIVEYEHRSDDDRWTVKARSRTGHEFAAPLFDILTGETPVDSGDFRKVGDRAARGLVAPWKAPADALPGGPIPPGMTQTLWIDLESLLPIRWSISVPAHPAQGTPGIPDYGLWITYDAAIDPHPPDGITPPDCIR